MLAKKAGIGEGAVADSLGATLGHAGAAHALVMLAAALESAQAGERILLASFGQGCDLLLFEVTSAIGSVNPRLGGAGWLARRVDRKSVVLGKRVAVRVDLGGRRFL